MTTLTPKRAPGRRRLIAAAVLLAAHFAAHGSGGDPTVPGELLVKLRTADALPRLLRTYRLTLAARFGARPIFRLKVIGPGSADAAIAALANEPDVLLAEPNVVHSSPEARKNHVWAIGTAQAYAVQWAPKAMRLPAAQKISTGAGVRVAVLDTGVDRRHPALAGRVSWGYDFVSGDKHPDERGSVGDRGFGHGTHVAGLIAMVAPQARILPLRVLDENGEGNAWVLAEALLYAVDPDGNPATDDGAQVINMSLGSVSRTRLLRSIAHLVACNPPDPGDPTTDDSDPGYNDDKARCAASGGAVIVAAAGNSGTDRLLEYPAAESVYGELAVGASSSNHRLSGFSNFGSWVDLAAPGNKITSSVPGGEYGTWSGTSMAAPLVAGTAALMRSAFPKLAPRDITRRIVRNAARLCDSQLGQLDAAAALNNRRAADLSCR